MKTSWKLFATAALAVVLSAPAFAETGAGAGGSASGSAAAGSGSNSGMGSGDVAAGTNTSGTNSAGNNLSASNPSTAGAGVSTNVTANNNGVTSNNNGVTGTGGADMAGVSSPSNINTGASASFNSGSTPRTYGVNTAGTGTGTTGSTSLSASTTSGGSTAFSSNDRRALNDYISSLPSGVRNSTDGSFRVGETLPQNTATSRLPATVSRNIAPAPNGYSYVQAGSNVYMISNNDRRIVDRVGIR
jgi:hypothetical protein